MSDEQLSPEDQEELNQLAGLVAKSLAEGKSQEDVAQQLVDHGWNKEEADQFVGSVALSLVQAQNEASHAGDDGGGMGWVIWIAALLLINLLSYLFDWPFFIY